MLFFMHFVSVEILCVSQSENTCKSIVKILVCTCIHFQKYYRMCLVLRFAVALEYNMYVLTLRHAQPFIQFFLVILRESNIQTQHQTHSANISKTHHLIIRFLLLQLVVKDCFVWFSIFGHPRKLSLMVHLQLHPLRKCPISSPPCFPFQ